MLDFDRYATEFRAETDRLGSALLDIDPALTLPTCPEWTVRDLVNHVGNGHRWSAGMVETAATVPPPQTTVDAPEDPMAWAGWLTAGAEQLLTAVTARGPDAPVWTWRADGTAGFWVRKMLHDEVIHRFDIELARGRLGELPPDLAVDGVEDWLDTAATLSPPGGWASGFSGLVGAGETIHLHVTDPGLVGEWLIRRTPDGAIWQPGHERADVAVRGLVLTMLLVVNRRLGPEHLEVLGDAAVFDHLLANSRF